MFFDPIAALLTKIRNANKVNKVDIKIQTSKLTNAILEVLKKEGYIKNFSSDFVVNKNGEKDKIKKETTVVLKYFNKATPSGKLIKVPVITNIKQVSKPSLRIYFGSNEFPKVLNSLGISIVSTSKGIITSKEAKKLNVGGELLITVW